MCCMGSIGRLNRSAMAACREGRLEEAEAGLRLALEQSSLMGLNCFEGKLQNNLGIVYELLGDSSRAADAYGRAFEIMECKLGAEHPACSRIRQSLERISDLRIAS